LSNCQVASEISRCSVDEKGHIYDTYVSLARQQDWNTSYSFRLCSFVVLVYKYIPWVRVEVKWKGDLGWASLYL
jgi:hypothetical protein